MSNDIVEGVFAIHKPPSISSAQVIRDVQSHFKESALFEPWLKQEAERLDEARKHQRRRNFRRDRRSKEVKIGHGGTLDPMATGVLILGVGSGTKKLSDFLSCTKSYDTVVLFGQATDTYDIVGKTVARKEYDHITKEQVESALQQFRGDIMQRPPIYSALRVQGKRLYEYAREGKEVPVEIQERPVTVTELELVEWYPGGTHKYNWPAAEAEQAEKEVAAKVLHLEPQTTNTGSKSIENSDNLKRERDDDAENTSTQQSKKVKASSDETVVGATGNRQAQSTQQHNEPTQEPQDPCPAPACRVKMTVTSGFYVRSLCHDLGAAVGSLGAMASLVRTRQGEFVLGENVFEYADLEEGEDNWSPTIRRMLEKSSRVTSE